MYGEFIKYAYVPRRTWQSTDSPKSDLIPRVYTHIGEQASKFMRIERTRASQIVSGERVYVEIRVRGRASNRAILDQPNFTVLQESGFSTASISNRLF